LICRGAAIPVVIRFEAAYREGTPPWDTGRPQGEVVRWEEAGRIEGSVLDLGCGTGENAMYLAEHGHRVVGVDEAPTALARARQKATIRRSGALFHLADALDLDPLLGGFRSFLDCGLFHTLPDAERPIYAASVARLAHRGARFFLLAFSDREPLGWGPRRIHHEEIARAFEPYWSVHELREGRFDTVEGPRMVYAWRAELHRTEAVDHQSPLR
jgi:SAM-dependent methyltransferase